MGPDLRIPCEHCGAGLGESCHPHCPCYEDVLTDLLMAAT